MSATLTAIAPGLPLPLGLADADCAEDVTGVIVDSAGQFIALVDPAGRMRRDEAQKIAQAIVFAVNAYAKGGPP